MIEFNESNPAPFVQPFLVISFQGSEVWHVDVDGKVDLYLDKEKFKQHCGKFGGERGLSAEKLQDASTPLLRSMARHLHGHGLKIVAVGIYKGSAGPSHILRHGVLFQRLGDLNKSPLDTPDYSWMVEPTEKR